MYEERMECYESTLLKEEWIGLERDNNTGKIDHSPSSINSKDSSDAVVGAMYNASQHAEEFAFEYGEDIENTINVSMSNDNSNLEQITLDFENELKSVFSTLPKNTQNDKKQFNSKQLDFGFGPAVPVTSDVGALISEGIMLW